ncbi:uncharacterized protein PG998_012769 [Apiospora kogelbergensis]|uniref:uncharacterized protein n=1 Tax=Apiospora kogelbergensis TaxID=1337665 RepID=UPI00312F148E
MSLFDKESHSPSSSAGAMSAQQKLVILTIDFGTSNSAQQYVILEPHEIEDRATVPLERIKSVANYPRDTNTVVGDQMKEEAKAGEEVDPRNRLLFGYEVHAVHEPADDRIQRRSMQTITSERLDCFKLLFQDDAETQEVRNELQPIIKRLQDSLHISKSAPHVSVTEDYFVRLLNHTKTQLKRLYGLEKGFIIEVVLCVPVVFRLAACRDLQTALAKALCLVKLGGLNFTDKWIPRFSMITEPEAGAEWVLKHHKEIQKLTRLLVVDSGGGTSDVSAFQVADSWPLRLEREDAPPTGDLCGSNIMNGLFYKEILQSLKEGAPYLEEARGKTLQEIAQDITTEQFEHEKRSFDLYEENPTPVLFKCEGVRPDQKHNFGKGIIRVPHGVIAQMFTTCLDKVWNLAKTQLDAARMKGRSIEIVVMLGGFSRSISYQVYLRRRLEVYNGEHGVVIQLLGEGQPIDPTAIAKGAALRALNKSSVPSRALPSSYGILRHIEDNEDGPEFQHLPPKTKRGKSIYKYVDGRWYFCDRIIWFAQKGEEVDSDREWTIDCEHFFPLSQRRLICEEEIYISDTVRQSGYKNDSLKNRGCPCIGEIEADMTSLRDEHLIYPEQNGNKQHWRVAFQLVIRVKGLDLEVEAKYKGEIKGSCIINMAPAIVSGSG